MLSEADEIRLAGLLGDDARDLLRKRMAELGLNCLPAGQGIISLDAAIAHCEGMARQGENDDTER